MHIQIELDSLKKYSINKTLSNLQINVLVDVHANIVFELKQHTYTCTSDTLNSV